MALSLCTWATRCQQLPLLVRAVPPPESYEPVTVGIPNFSRYFAHQRSSCCLTSHGL